MHGYIQVRIASFEYVMRTKKRTRAADLLERLGRGLLTPREYPRWVGFDETLPRQDIG